MGNKLKKENIISIIILLIFSILFVLPLQRTHTIFFGDDLPYHINRIKEIKENLLNGNIYPNLYTYNFRKTGFLLGNFYPQITLYPFVLFSILLGSLVNGIYAGIAFYCFLSMVFMYHIMKKVNKKNEVSLIAAILYGFSSYHTIDAFTRFAIGEYIAMTFLPIVFYGFYAIFYGDRKDWYYLSFGLSFILLSHVLTTYITVLILGIIFVIEIFKKEEKFEIFKTILKSICLFIFSSLIFLLPFLNQVIANDYNQPSPVNVFDSATTLDQSVINALKNNFNNYLDGGYYSIGIVGIVIILLGIIHFMKFNEQEKKIFLIGLFTYIGSTKLFPWFLFTKLYVIQFSSRILSISTLFISIFGAILFDKFANRKVSTYIYVILIICMSWCTGIYNFSKGNIASTLDTYVDGKIYTGGKNKEDYWYLDQYNTKKAVKNIDDIFYRRAYINDKAYKIKQVKAIPNGLVYKDKALKNKKNVELPISNYRNVRVFQGTKEVEHNESKRGFIKIKETENKDITVKYIKSWNDYIAIFISLGTWIFSLIYFNLKSKKTTLSIKKDSLSINTDEEI